MKRRRGQGRVIEMLTGYQLYLANVFGVIQNPGPYLDAVAELRYQLYRRWLAKRLAGETDAPCPPELLGPDDVT